MVCPALFLRKPPSNSGTKASELEEVCLRRFRQWKEKDWAGLIKCYEEDCVKVQDLKWRPVRENKSERDEQLVRRACELLSRAQFGKARKLLQSNGLGDHMDEAIIEQMRKKHPERKEEITPLTEEELSYPRKGITQKVFEDKHLHLHHDTAPGIDCLRNEHLTGILFSKNRKVSAEARAAATNLFQFANNVVLVNLPTWFYTAWLATRLVPANKVHPKDLPEGTQPDCRPVKIGGSER